MSYFEFPHTRSYDGDLGYIIKVLDELTKRYNNFFDYNSIKFHDPIDWNIETIYTAFEIVYDESSEGLFISKTAVPAGVNIDNEDFWLLVSPFKIETSLSHTSINPVANKTITAALDSLGGDVSAEESARIAADNALQQNINAEITARTEADQGLSARIDNIIEGASVDPDAELVDIRTNSSGTAYTVAGDAVRALEANINAIESFKFISNSYIRYQTGIPSDATGTTRVRTDYLLCPENASITYSGTTNSANVAGIAFYGETKNYISGVANNEATIGTPVTVTSPAGTKYCIISTDSTILDKFVYSTPTGGLLNLANDFYFANYDNQSYIKFVTTGSNRSQNFTDISNIKLAQVVDADYLISLWYDNGNSNTPWLKSIKLTDYANVHHLQLRRVDNGNIAAFAGERVAKGFKSNSFITFDYLNSTLDTVAYIDCDDGNDNNNGTGRATAFKTITTAVNKGFKNLCIKPGTYEEAVSFNYLDNIKMYADKYYSNFANPGAVDTPHVIIDGSGHSHVLVFSNCNNIVLEGITVTNSGGNGFTMDNCNNVKCTDCKADTVGLQGFNLTDINGSFYDCECVHIGTMGGGEHHDGFNIHGTGTTNFINCSASYCEDDGISHHDACTGYIDGGEWHHCGKGGVASPTHGAVIDVRNIYSHDNGYGIYCLADQDFNRRSVNFTNCACKDNSTMDIIINENYTANVWNCIYDTISTGENINIIG